MRIRTGAVAVLALGALIASGCGDDDDAPATTGDAAVAVAETTTSSSAGADSTDAAEPTTTVAADAVVTDAEVERLDDGTLSLTWSTDLPDAPVAVLWGPDPASPDQPLEGLEAVTSGGAVVDDPSGGGRPYFRLEAAGGGMTVAERRLSLEGQPNFRDLGGYETADGRHVRWGQLYRSGELGELTAADQAYVVDTLGINLVCDLRSPGEVEELADPAFPGVESVNIPVFDDSVDPVAIEAAILAGDLSALDPTLLVTGNESFVRDHTAEYAALMQRVTDPASWPTNLHCTAGKDRAGWGSAVILLALGVPEDTVMADYLLSGVYRAESNAATVEQVRTVVAAVRGVEASEITDTELEPLVALLDVREEYLQAALDTMHAEYGGIDGYLTDGLGLTTDQIEAFRDAMLE